MPLQALLTPRSRDIGDGFMVRRALPAAECRSVGPFVFFDQMGPADLPPGPGLAVRPHPHIGLATLTYLFEGEIMHRDSLGTVQAIRPGEVNWMTAGRGIAHSERTPERLQSRGSHTFGIQAWIALPAEHEETAPAFAHAGAAALPERREKGVVRRLIAGTLDGERSPVETFSPMFYVDADAAGDATLEISGEHEERAAYVASGKVTYEHGVFEEGQMLVFPRGGSVALRTLGPSRVLLLGGTPLGKRFLWWNFVSSSKERIDQAADDWQAGRFPAVPQETEFIPLPDRPAAVKYP